MAINLLEKTTEILGYAPLKKVDPNTEKIKVDSGTHDNQLLAQTVIPTVLAGLSQLSKSEEGIMNIVTGSQFGWASLIFGQYKEEVVGNIAGFVGRDYQSIEQKINEVANQAVKLIRENCSDVSDNYSKMKDFIKSQRDNILPFLPPEIHLGNVLNNSTIDDKTNKMQGPLSSLMHKIEAGFGGNETEEDAERKSNKT